MVGNYCRAGRAKGMAARGETESPAAADAAGETPQRRHFQSMEAASARRVAIAREHPSSKLA